MNVLMLCAGEGTRLRPYTLTLPKPAIPVMGVPMAFWAYNLLPSDIIKQVAVNTFHLPHEIHRLFEDKIKYFNSLLFSDESPKILGSGGGFRKAHPLFKDQSCSTVLVNGDEIIIPKHSGSISDFYNFHRESGAIATLLTTHHPEVGTKFGGVWSKDQVVKGFGKQAIANTNGHHFIGVMAVRPEILKFTPTEGEANILYDSFVNAINAGHLVNHFHIDCFWRETGNFEDYFVCQKDLMKELHQQTSIGKYILDLRDEWLGLNQTFQFFSDEKQVLSRRELSKAELEQISGMCILGSTQSITANLQNVIVSDDAHIKDNLKNTLVLR
jgi:mannose-1-phosphate guanylyltransferase